MRWLVAILACLIVGCSTTLPPEDWMADNKNRTILAGEGYKDDNKVIGALKDFVRKTKIKKLGTKTNLGKNADLYFRFGNQTKGDESPAEILKDDRGIKRRNKPKEHPHFRFNIKF